VRDIQNSPVQLYAKLRRFFLEREIANFYSYLDSLDQVLNAARQHASENIEQLNNELSALNQPDDTKKELIDFMVEAEQLKGFSNLLRQSFLTSLYSFLELWLRRECYLDSKHRNQTKAYESMGSGIEGAKKYLSRIMQSSYDFNSPDWQWIIKFKKLRDCIVHRQGSLTGFSDYPVDSTLFGVDKKQIFVEREFCLGTLEIVHKFLGEILSSNQ
jgi:hypothetical protein